MLLRNHQVSGKGKLDEIILDFASFRGGHQACQERLILKKTRSVYPRESDMAKWSTLSIVGEIQVKTATPKLTRMTRVVMLSLFKCHPLPKPVYWKSLSRNGYTYAHSA